MYRTELIQAVIDKTKAKSYLEIGVCSGKNFRQIKCERKVGVDPIPPNAKNIVPILDVNVTYHQMTSDRYFELFGKTEQLNVIFIDGLHTKEQVWCDFLNSLLCVTPGSVIIFHDCNPTTKAMQIVPQQQKRWTGDVWKAWVAIRAFIHDLKIGRTVCMQDDYGLGVVFVDNIPNDVPDYFLVQDSEQLLNSLTYGYLEQNRASLLGLVSGGKFLKILNG